MREKRSKRDERERHNRERGEKLIRERGGRERERERKSEKRLTRERIYIYIQPTMLQKFVCLLFTNDPNKLDCLFLCSLSS